jgi:hypothetical protein
MKFVHLVWVDMRRSMHRELIRWMLALAVFGCVFAGVIAFLTSGDQVKLAADGEHPAYMARWWVPGTGDGFLLVAAMFLVIGAVICGASFAGAEWRAGTITTTLTWDSARARFHAARTGAAVVMSFVIALALQVLFMVSLAPSVWVHGTTDGVDAAWWRSLILGMLRIALATVLVCVLAASIATIGRNTSAALVAIAAWAMVIERTIAGLRPQWARFMISENVAIFVPWTPLRDAEFDRGPAISLITLLAYTALIVLAAVWSFRRRDIAAAS